MNTTFKNGNQTLVVFITGNEEDTALTDAFPYSFLLVSSTDWNKDLTPWPAGHVLKGGGDFSGEADAFLEQVLAEEHLKGSWEHIYLCGYSLAGLFTLYACTKTDLFDACASVSGSLWYPGFIAYLKEHPVHCKKVYLSLGDLEKNSKQALLSTVEEKTKEAAELFQTYTSVRFEMNPGNHFKDANERIIKAIQQL